MIEEYEQFWREEVSQTRRYRIILFILAAACLGVMLVAFPLVARAQERIDNAIVFVVDVSGSMSQEELRIARQSHASAITSKEVLNAIEDGRYQRSAVAYVEFGRNAKIIVSWTLIEKQADAIVFATHILEPRSLDGSETNVGDALVKALELVLSLPYKATSTAVDVVGDGRHSVMDAKSPNVMDVRDAILATGASINAMPVLLSQPEAGLSEWFESHVVGGPRHFLIELSDIAEMPLLMRRKLIMELF